MTKGQIFPSLEKAFEEMESWGRPKEEEAYLLVDQTRMTTEVFERDQRIENYNLFHNTKERKKISIQNKRIKKLFPSSRLKIKISGANHLVQSCSNYNAMGLGKVGRAKEDQATA